MKKFLLVALAASVAVPAIATPTVYTDKAAFLAATQAVQFDFPETGDPDKSIQYGASYAQSGVTFKAAGLFGIASFSDQFFAASYLGADPLVTVSTGYTFLGLDLAVFDPASTSMTYTINGESFTVDLAASPDTSFLGFVDTRPITATFDVSDNEIDFTHFYTASVPEPASWAMMIAGFGLVGMGLRQRRSAVRFG